MAMPGSMPISLSAGGGGPSSSGSNAGVQTPISNPFNFDGSGWVVNFGNGNTTTANGNKDANGTQQTGNTPGGLGALLGGMDPLMLLMIGGALLLMKRK
jgi:hypothetical protein